MMEALHRILPAPVAAVVSLTSASASWVIAVVEPWQEHVDWGLRVGASCVAIVVGVHALRGRKKKDRSTD